MTGQSTVAIIDYGSGNLRSAEKSFERAAREIGAETDICVTSSPDVVAKADRIVLPGVGAFADCRRGLYAVDGMVEALREAVENRAAPFLGICVGMQLMADRGLEHEKSRRTTHPSRSPIWVGTRWNLSMWLASRIRFLRVLSMASTPTSCIPTPSSPSSLPMCSPASTMAVKSQPPLDVTTWLALSSTRKRASSSACA